MSVTVEFQPSGRRFTAESADTLLEAALRSGGSPMYGCVNGSCGECKARVLSGETETVRFHDYTLPAAERDQGYVLMCCTAPRSDKVVVEAVEAGS
ncbi:MAG: hypothetical protein DRQ37_06545, partial [Gammaproteobacteria bacterium]